jgi:DNA-binding IclR family transcriptional regulator
VDIGGLNDENGGLNGEDGTVNGIVNINAILQVISENPRTTYEELSERLYLPRRTVARAIKNLRDSGVIKRIGSDKTGHWQIAVGREIVPKRIKKAAIAMRRLNCCLIVLIL